VNEMEGSRVFVSQEHCIGFAEGVGGLADVRRCAGGLSLVV